jgi:hypothetical protein
LKSKRKVNSAVSEEYHVAIYLRNNWKFSARQRVSEGRDNLHPLTYISDVYDSLPFIFIQFFSPTALKITFSGSANCKFEDSIDGSFFKSDVMFSGHEKYISHSTYLFGSSNSDVQDFKSGSHTFAFWYKIPLHVPATIKGKHGKIRYTVEASLLTEWKFDLYARESFAIIRFEDLSRRVDLMEGKCDEITTSFCCWSCTTRPLHLKASIPFHGYIPEQLIRITVIISNNCGFDVSSTITSISQVPERKRWMETKVLTKISERGAKNGKSPTKLISEIQIPKFTLPTNVASNVVQVSYYVQVNLDVVGFIRSPKVKLPIVIGTKALKFENKL